MIFLDVLPGLSGVNLPEVWVVRYDVMSASHLGRINHVRDCRLL